MELKRNDNRRRRVLFDEAVQQTAVQSNGGDPAGPKRRRANHYSARDAHLLRTSDLIPTRFVSLALIASGSIAAIGLINVLDWLSAKQFRGADDSLRRAFSLASPTGLANWMVTLTWFLSGLFCLQNYVMRRHRRDDYRGTYRVWIVFATVCVFCSIQSVVPVDRVAAMFLSQIVPTSAAAPGQWGNVAIKLLLVVLLFCRLMLEIRESRTALLFGVLCGLLFGLMMLRDVPGLATSIGLDQARWLQDNLYLIGAVVLLNCVIAYSRYVCLDASGLIQHVRRKARKRKSRAGSRGARRRSGSMSDVRPRHSGSLESGSKTVSDDANHSPLGSNSRTSRPRDESRGGPLRSKIEALHRQTAETDDDESWDDDDRESDDSGPAERLSKAERRRLKKLHRRQRNAA